MPLLDVTDNLYDPDFATRFSVTRVEETVGSNGRSTAATSTTTPNIVGVVVPASGHALKLLPEGTRVEGAIEVFTSHRLRMQTDAQQPDQIIWNDRTYTVSNIKDWTEFGAGYVQAVCTLSDLTDAPR